MLKNKSGNIFFTISNKSRPFKMADEQMVDDTTKQPDESAEPPQKKRCLPEFLKEDSAKWTLDPDLAEGINGAINKRLSDDNVQ